MRDSMHGCCARWQLPRQTGDEHTDSLLPMILSSASICNHSPHLLHSLCSFSLCTVCSSWLRKGRLHQGHHGCCLCLCRFSSLLLSNLGSCIGQTGQRACTFALCLHESYIGDCTTKSSSVHRKWQQKMHTQLPSCKIDKKLGHSTPIRRQTRSNPNIHS